MKQLASIILCLIILLPIEKGWTQDIDNTKRTEPSGSMIESIVNNISELGANIKNVFISPPDLVMEQKRQSMDAIRDLQNYISDIIELRKREENAPERNWFDNKTPNNKLFGDTKHLVRQDLNAILRDLQNILVGDQYDYIEQISNQDELIKELKDEVAELQEMKMVAPENGGIFRDGKDEIQEKIKSKLDEIVSYEKNIDEIYKSAQERYKLLGIELPRETIETLMRRIDGNDVMQNVGVFNSINQLTPVLAELTNTSRENRERYYGVYVILSEVAVFSQQQYINKSSNIYSPKLKEMLDEVNGILKAARKNLAEEEDINSKKVYESNIVANLSTIDTIDMYLNVLSDQRNTVQAAMKISKRKLLLAHNTFETSTAASAILEIIQNSESEFNAIMAMQVPEIVPFENEDMKTKFYNMTKDVRASL